MSDEENQNQTQATETRPPVDWDVDAFPTSAKKIFISWGLMLLGIAVLCVLVYSRSEHPVEAKSDAKKAARAQLSGFTDTDAEDE